MAESLGSLALEKLDRILGDEVASLVGVTVEIERLSSTFTFIQAVLKDAEIQRLKDEAVKIWLEKLRGLAYDVDDILDEWMMEALKSQAPNEADGSCFSKKKVRSFLSPVTCFNHVVLRHKIGYRIKEARERLDYIAEERSQLGLSEVSRGEIREGETGSLLDPSSIVGREEDKNEVLNLLLREIGGELNEVPFVISIYGMGGFGKTTLAQIAYNEKVKGHFEIRLWLCVSEDFNVKLISKSILKSEYAESKGGKLDLDHLQLRLHETLQVKRFLLVLDDIWGEDGEKWDKLKLSFPARVVESRIAITTHREIVKKCGGVPLAAKTIGSAMCLKPMGACVEK